MNRTDASNAGTAESDSAGLISNRMNTLDIRFDDVVDRAADLFNAFGYRNTTMQQIADSLGMAKPTLYTRAKGKPELLEGIFEKVIDTGDKVIAQAMASSQARIEQIESIVFRWTAAAIDLNAHYHVFRSDERELASAVRTRLRKRRQRQIDLVRGIVVGAQEEGSLRADLDPTIAVELIAAATTWTPRWSRPVAGPGAEEIAHTFCTVLVTGMTATGKIRRPGI